MLDTRIKFVLDTDVGLDDAEAVAFATKCKKIDLLAITLVSGNDSMKTISENLRRSLDFLNVRNVPVYESGSYNLLGKYVKSDGYFGENAFANITFPETDIVADSNMRAPAALIHYSRKYPKQVHFGFVGPLTNLAMAFLMDPEFGNYAASIYIMGGDTNEETSKNVSKHAEFNFFSDAAAARIVASCLQNRVSVPIILVDWSVCTKNLLSKTMFDRLFKTEELKKGSNKHLNYFSIIRDFSNEIIARSMWEEGFLTCDLWVPLILVDSSIVMGTKRINITDVCVEGEKIGHVSWKEDKDGLFVCVSKLDTVKAENLIVSTLLEDS